MTGKATASKAIISLEVLWRPSAQLSMTSHRVLSNHELYLLDIVTRVVSCVSMASAFFTITSYLSSRDLRKKHFNRLAFFIAASNICGGLAYSWGVYPLFAGRHSPFCQAQAFLIEWFVMADPLLVLVMAASVWFRICTQQDSTSIHRIENVGITCALGLPFMPSLVFLCWRPNGFTVYGPAGLWCWISAESNSLRISAFYAPIWGFLLISVILFSISGSRIMHTRVQVRRAQSVGQPEERSRKLSVASLSNYVRRKSLSGGQSSSPSDTNGTPSGTREDAPQPTFPVRVHSAPELLVAPIHINTDDSFWSQRERSRSNPSISLRTSSRFQAMHWKYTKFACLCCFVLLATWVPISIMRIYNNFINPEHPIIALYYASAVCIPLQGVGNFLVYLTNNWKECRAWVKNLVSGGCLKEHGVSGV